MSENSQELFRKTLKEFKAADALLSDQLQSCESNASAARKEIANQAETAGQIALGYRQQIEGKGSFSDLSGNLQISPPIDQELHTLKILTRDICQQEKALADLKRRIGVLNQNFKAALAQERSGRNRNKLVFALFAVTIVVGIIFLHFQLLKNTTLSFAFTVDGKPLPTDKAPVIILDGKPFASGDKIKLGHHQFSVKLDDAEPLTREFWTFYGAKNLGTLPVESSKGSVSLSSDPPDAGFELSNGDKHWQGKLPQRIENIPAGNYFIATTRKGWKIEKEISVTRGATTTNKIEFPYGSIEVTSEPSGLMVLTNGVEIARTPTVLRDVIPGRYTLGVADGENQLNAEVEVAAKEAVKKSFVLHYGSIKIKSTPPGASVVRNKKEAGKTPLTLDRVPAGESDIEVYMYGYGATNVFVRVSENATVNYNIKLFSDGYIASMKEARAALDAGQLSESLKFIADALNFETNEPAALKLQGEVSAAAAKADAQQKETARKADLEKTEAARKTAEIQKEQERVEIVAIIEKAIQAVGGREAINRFRASKVVSRATGKNNGEDFSRGLICYRQLPGRLRLEQETVSMPKKGLLALLDNQNKPTRKSVFCITESDTWSLIENVMGEVERKPVSPENQKGFQYSLYSFECKLLIPLLGSDFTLEKLPSSSSTPSSTTGIKVHKASRNAEDFFFDSQSGFLVEIHGTWRDGKNLIHQDITRYREYRNFSGLMFPTIDTYDDGVNTSSNMATESIEPLDQYAADRVFAQPQNR